MASTSSSVNVSSQLEFRRRGDPLSCQRIWDAIKACRHDKHVPTLKNIQKMCVRLYPTMDDEVMVEEQIKYLILDKLIIKNKMMSSKGSLKGSEYFAYSIPLESEIDFDRSHDWYCFICHKPGEVLTCISCPKVYHIPCLEKEKVIIDRDCFTCTTCSDIQQQPVFPASEKKIFNNLLSYASCRLDSLEHKLPDRVEIWNPAADSPIYSAAFTTDRRATMIKKSYLRGPSSSSPIPEGLDLWRSRFLLHKPMNHDMMMSKADRQVYKSLTQFQLDSATIVHNVTIFHGENSPLADRARMLHRDCIYELGEIKLCPDCYRCSNEQHEEDWFCQPCDPPHELVFAKAKGYPYWPAKVLRKQGAVYDVRFFGTSHDRATLGVDHILPITTCTNTLVPTGKRSSKWIKAVDELMKHQEILRNLESPKNEPSDSSDAEMLDHSDRHSPVVPSKMLRLSVDVNRLPAYLWSSSVSGTCATAPATIPDCKIPSSADCVPFSTGADDITKLNGKLDSLNQEIIEIRQQHSSELKAAKDRHKESLTSQLQQAQKDKESQALLHLTEINQLKEQLELAKQEIVRLKHRNNHELCNKQVSVAEEVVPISSLTENGPELAKVEIEELKRAHANEIQDLMDKHASFVSIIKTKSWCKSCTAEGLLHCCLNVWYCSTDCQRLAWKDHKATCKRDRTARNHTNQARDSVVPPPTKK